MKRNYIVPVTLTTHRKKQHTPDLIKLSKYIFYESILLAFQRRNRVKDTIQRTLLVNDQDTLLSS